VTVHSTLRIRTITLGTNIASLTDLKPIELAIETLTRSRQRFEASGYEVQTLRIAIPALLARCDERARTAALTALHALDKVVSGRGVILNLGPLLTVDRRDSTLANWTVELVRSTRSMSFSAVVASASGVHLDAAFASAQIMRSLASALPGGLANFRFAAAANIPSGTPFFPVAWHEGADSIAIGVEGASLVERAWTEPFDRASAERQLKKVIDDALRPIQSIGETIAKETSRAWLGIDASPAPGPDRSIAAGIERFTGAPFGSASTLHACGTITAALKSLDVKTCGYSGLMLPVLEDPLLAQRASEQRYGIRDLLLYSSVCGTGLDVVPVPADTPVETIAGLITDVAALSTRLRKPLSVRLLLVPDKQVGDVATFDDPILSDCRVMKID